MKVSVQLNTRVDEDTANLFDKIMEYERSKLKIGKLSRSDVLTHIIKEYHKLIEKENRVSSK